MDNNDSFYLFGVVILGMSEIKNKYSLRLSMSVNCECDIFKIIPMHFFLNCSLKFTKLKE